MPTIGLDLGGTKLAAAVFSDAGDIMGREVVALKGRQGRAGGDLIAAQVRRLIERFAVDKVEAGSLLSLMSLGILVGSVVFGPIADRFGYKMLLIACTTLILVGVEGIAAAPTFGWLRAAVFVVGFGGGIINGGTNALVADISEDRRGAGLSLLGVFFGAGAFGLPFTLGFLVERFAYTTLVAGVGVLVLVPLLFVAAIGFPAPKQAQGCPLHQGLRLLKEPVLWLFGLLLFLQSGMEITSSGWTTTYVDEVLGLTGGSLLPYLTGLLGERFDLRASFLVLPVGLVLMAVLLGLAVRQMTATPAGPPPG